MDSKTLSSLHEIFNNVQSQQDWKAALDTLFVSLRGAFVFDNVVIYLIDAKTNGMDVAYARAVGRGKTAEADVAWGELFAGEIIAAQKMLVREPSENGADADRLRQDSLLGFPLFLGGKLEGAIVFVRFGGPQYTEEHIQLASLQAFWTSALLERKKLQDARAELDSVQRQMRLQDDFVSTISHELRTPLGFIKGYSTSLLRQDTSWDAATQREFLLIIDEEADRLTRLIEDMLESARLQSKTLQFKFAPLRLDALVRDIGQRVTMRQPKLKVAFDIQPLRPIRGDSLRLSQVFENLFSNAVKYAPESAVTIHMSTIGDHIRVAFSDHGEGIAEDYIPFLFERFYRVPGQRTTPGTGLGLYICKQIIMAHHGKIWVESEPDKGTTFLIELPCDSTL